MIEWSDDVEFLPRPPEIAAQIVSRTIIRGDPCAYWAETASALQHQLNERPGDITWAEFLTAVVGGLWLASLAVLWRTTTR